MQPRYSRPVQRATAMPHPMAVRTHKYLFPLVALFLVSGVAAADPGGGQHRPRPRPDDHRERMDRDASERITRFQSDDGSDSRARIQRRRPEQDDALEMRRSGSIRPLREIEGRVLPKMNGADYLGPEFDSGSGIYRLKFMRAGSVIWVDVDARTGAVIGRAGR